MFSKLRLIVHPSDEIVVPFLFSRSVALSKLKCLKYSFFVHIREDVRLPGSKMSWI